MEKGHAPKDREKAVHDLRVSTRRLIATLGTAGRVSRTGLSGVQSNSRRCSSDGPFGCSRYSGDLRQIRAIDPLKNSSGVSSAVSAGNWSRHKDLNAAGGGGLSNEIHHIRAVLRTPEKPVDMLPYAMRSTPCRHVIGVLGAAAAIKRADPETLTTCGSH